MSVRSGRYQHRAGDTPADVRLELLAGRAPNRAALISTVRGVPVLAADVRIGDMPFDTGTWGTAELRMTSDPRGSLRIMCPRGRHRCDVTIRLERRAQQLRELTIEIDGVQNARFPTSTFWKNARWDLQRVFRTAGFDTRVIINDRNVPDQADGWTAGELHQALASAVRGIQSQDVRAQRAPRRFSRAASPRRGRCPITRVVARYRGSGAAVRRAAGRISAARKEARCSITTYSRLARLAHRPSGGRRAQGRLQQVDPSRSTNAPLRARRGEDDCRVDHRRAFDREYCQGQVVPEARQLRGARSPDGAPERTRSRADVAGRPHQRARSAG